MISESTPKKYLYYKEYADPQELVKFVNGSGAQVQQIVAVVGGFGLFYWY